MGNKNSSRLQQPKGQQPHASQGQGQSQGQVKKRDKKHKSGRPRPTSDPESYVGAGDSNLHHRAPRSSQQPTRNPSFNEHQPSGDRPQTLPADARQLPPHMRDNQGIPPPNPAEIYHKSLEQLLGIWPEYSPLRNIDLKKIKAPIPQTLQQVFTRLFEQHTFIATLSREKHEVNELMKELEEERDSLSQRLKSKNQENENLKEDLAHLKGELQRRGISAGAHLPVRHGSDDISDSGRGHTRGPSSTSDAFSEDEDPKGDIAKRMSKVMYSPTPITQLFSPEKAGQALRRSSSLKTSSSPYGHHPAKPYNIDQGSSNRLVEELNQKILRLEAALDRERREKQLVDRVGSADPRSSKSPIRGVSVEGLVNRYEDLETSALSRINQTLDNNLGHVEEKRKYMFICAIMELSYQVATDMVQELHSNIRRLLFNPLGSENEGKALRRKTSNYTAPIRNLDFSKMAGLSKLEQRRLAVGELPQPLSEQIRNFLESKAENTNVAGLAEGVMDDLSSDFSDCVTSALLNHSIFTQFLYDCCRVAWTMAVISPPMYLTADNTHRFDERYHAPLPGQKPSQVAEVDFLVWPILYSRRHGDILYKGRVSLQNAPSQGPYTGGGQRL